MWLVAANFLVLESFVLAAVHVGQVMMFLSTSKRQMLFSGLQLFISIQKEKYYTLEGQSLECGLSYIFQATGNILIL